MQSASRSFAVPRRSLNLTRSLQRMQGTGVAPGQSAVFYDGERLLGGGTITATQAPEMVPA
ncbi:MAG: hypothetical protein HKP29_12735 [Silicimonas sp.]|nr:hypothetical protein [Silicimonas sp.]